MLSSTLGIPRTFVCPLQYLCLISGSWAGPHPLVRGSLGIADRSGAASGQVAECESKKLVGQIKLKPYPNHVCLGNDTKLIIFIYLFRKLHQKSVIFFENFKKYTFIGFYIHNV